MKKKILLHDEIAHILVSAHDAAPSVDQNSSQVDSRVLARYTRAHIDALESIVLRLARELDSLKSA